MGTLPLCATDESSSSAFINYPRSSKARRQQEQAQLSKFSDKSERLLSVAQIHLCQPRILITGDLCSEKAVLIEVFFLIGGYEKSNILIVTRVTGNDQICEMGQSKLKKISQSSSRTCRQVSHSASTVTLEYCSKMEEVLTDSMRRFEGSLPKEGKGADLAYHRQCD